MFHKKYALINIITFNITFHNFHQFPSIFQPFPDTMVFSIPFQRFPTSKVALMHRPTRVIGGSKSTPCLGAQDMGLIFFAQNEISFIIYFITYSQKGSKIDTTCKSRMYRMFLSFQNLDGNIYSWNLYVYARFPKPRMVPEWGNCCWLWRSLRIATIWSAWKVKGARFRWEILTQFIEKWWMKYEKYWKVVV